MSSITGIFEPFLPYVQMQLNQRKEIISNAKISLKNENYFNTKSRYNETNRVHGSNTDGVFSGYSEEVLGKKGLKNYYNLDPHTFYKLTIERQCTIRLSSGVDIKQKNDLLDTDNEEQYQTGAKLAKKWVLVGEGRRNETNYMYPQPLTNPNGLVDMHYGGGVEDDTYVQSILNRKRNEAGEGYGHVPNPGITDAEISTKSEDGSLREASINFVCHNRRQLEVLEALYMRPGYPLMLEWGWLPYIKDDWEIENEFYPILPEFFKNSSDLNSLNLKLRERKIDSGGNYDGFIGFCKNFSFTAREDGGFNCSTEIMAQAEILSSLKTKTKLVPPVHNPYDVTSLVSGSMPPQKGKEPIDELLYFFRAIRDNLDKAGDSIYLKLTGTSNETYDIGNVNKTASWVIKDNTGFEIDFTALNETNSTYEEGLNELISLASDVSKVSVSNLERTWRGEYGIPNWLENQKYRDKEDTTGGFGERYIGYNASDQGGMFSGAFPQLIPFAPGSKGALATRLPNEDDFASQYDLYPRQHYLGFDAFLDGLVLKELAIVDDPTTTDSGIRKRVYVRWDFICQILNKKTTPEYKKDNAVAEITYLHPNQPTYSPTPVSEGKGVHNETIRYLEYSKPGQKKHKYQETIFNDLPEGLIGGSFDANICLMPHQIENFQLVMLDDPDKTGYFNKVKGRWAGRSIDDNQRNVSETIMGELPEDNAWNMTTEEFLNEYPEYDNRNTYGELANMGIGTGAVALRGNFTSFSNIAQTDRGIGNVYFNLNYLINTYSNHILETYTNSKGKSKTRIRKQTSFHDWITEIWDGVNEACGGYYDFGLHVEHERPHVARIIDFTFMLKSKDLPRDIFEFNPQGLGSITRDIKYQSKLDESFSSAISIAAQVPNDIHSLEAMSFKAFHKNIRNRFTTVAQEAEERLEMMKVAKEEYLEDLKEYYSMTSQLDFYLKKMYQSNLESRLYKPNSNDLGTKGSRGPKTIGPITAVQLANSLEELMISIESRYPEKSGKFSKYGDGYYFNGGDQVDGHYIGEWKGDATHARSAIIPLTTSIVMDGISGISPLNIFKIAPDKLPLGYQNPFIVFVVKQERQKITQGQDWTTEISGYLSLLNDNPMFGTNSVEFKNLEEFTKKKLDEKKKYDKKINSTAWSAMFISYCASNAGASETYRIDFKTSPLHTDYFNLNKGPGTWKGKGLFRHYNPQTTPVELGDIILKSTYDSSANVAYPGPYSGGSHADIVVAINNEMTYRDGNGYNSQWTYDENFGQITLVGGNLGKPGKGKVAQVKVNSIMTTHNAMYNIRPPFNTGDDKEIFLPNEHFPITSPRGGGPMAVGGEEASIPGYGKGKGFEINNYGMVKMRNIHNQYGFLIQGAYKNGSILRAKNWEEYGQTIYGNAIVEFDNWGKDWTELSPEAEETMRKYYEVGGITLPEFSDE